VAGGTAAALAAVTPLIGIAGLVTRKPGVRPWLVDLLGISAGHDGDSLDRSRPSAWSTSGYS
jgi:hypothetical protein